MRGARDSGPDVRILERRKYGSTEARSAGVTRASARVSARR